MTEAQKRALWATLFRQLADAIVSGGPIPTSLHLWTQWVDATELAVCADTAWTEPLPIDQLSTVAQVKIPIGDGLSLDAKWNVQAKLREEDKAGYALHNAICVPTGEPGGDPEPAGLADTKEN